MVDLAVGPSDARPEGAFEAGQLFSSKLSIKGASYGLRVIDGSK